MIFEALPLPGAYRVAMEKKADSRGHFARTFCVKEFSDRGLDPAVAQANVSFNRLRGTLRGLHWQASPHGEAKLIRATRGAVWDVMVDLRPSSPAYLKWHAETLDEENGIMLYIPEGFAHGFVTLRDGTELSYQMSTAYEPAAARGARYDDPAFGIAWPDVGALTVSDRDLAFPRFVPGTPV